jgi:hypothetical protein
VLATREKRQQPAGPPRAGPFSRESLAGSWGIGQNVTWGLPMDMLWGLASVRILCLEIARCGLGSRERVADYYIAGIRA